MTRTIVLLILILTGCAEKPTVNEQQATTRVEQLIRDTVRVIEPRPRLDAFLPSLNRRYCVDPADGGSEERVVVNRRYYLRGIPKDRFVEVAHQVKAHWQKEGHVITGVNGLQAGEPDISGRSRPDDFILSLSWTQGDVLGIGVTSTCVWPDAT
ncbi:hypothetical protein GCM10010404_02010 [Nonomuraea africana]|uniref:Lipoprotein n=1 Tax=Nonomuraea africana TaxID=46171 RepID=A0ABR9KBM6_9ACTN|nr:hypothetical protein [Nonomuraea africana]MBE1559418.1 hypothetical protein [Nonomuraea africana]